MKNIIAIFLILFIAQPRVHAQSRSAIETSTDILMFLPGAVGASVSLAKGDYKGLLQLAESGVTAVAAAYALKYTIHKRRPDGSDNHSFPSNHAGCAFAGAAFLQRRYGWEWGVPAYAVAAYVGWGRVYSKKHDTWDVLAGTAIGVCSAWLFTRPFAERHNIAISPFATPEGSCGFHLSMNL